MRVGENDAQFGDDGGQAGGELLWSAISHGAQELHTSGLRAPRVFFQRLFEK